MRVTMNYDGRSLKLYLYVEGDYEQAMAELMVAHTVAELEVVRESPGYGYMDTRDCKTQCVVVNLTKPVEV